jgi:hypothetical protein
VGALRNASGKKRGQKSLSWKGGVAEGRRIVLIRDGKLVGGRARRKKAG